MECTFYPVCTNLKSIADEMLGMLRRFLHPIRIVHFSSVQRYWPLLQTPFMSPLCAERPAAARDGALRVGHTVEWDTAQVRLPTTKTQRGVIPAFKDRPIASLPILAVSHAT
jgi:hypothetical protein